MKMVAVQHHILVTLYMRSTEFSKSNCVASSENKSTKLGGQLQDVYGRKSPERFGHNCPGSYIKVRIQNLLGRLEKTIDNMYLYRIHSSEYRGTNFKN